MVDAAFYYEHLAKSDAIPKQGIANRKPDGLCYNIALHVSSRPASYRKIALWCNIGPASKDVAILEKIISAGMTVACLNLSLGSRQCYPEIIRNIREAEANYICRTGVSSMIAIALEIRGPEIRTGALDGNRDCPVNKGDTLKLTTDKAYLEKGNGATVYIDYEDILKIIQPDDRVFVSDGTISLIVTAIHGSTIITTIECDGVLKSNRSVFLPNFFLQLPALSDKDKELISYGIDAGIHFILANRVRNAADVTAIKDYLGAAASHIQIVAKIESFEALQNFDEIMDASDLVFINRNYIGVEIPSEKVFVAQKNIIAKCNRNGVQVIVAEQFMESMLNKRRPTRAESVDIANAIIDGADGIFITETAHSNYPVECVSVTSTICIEAESAVNQWARFRELASAVNGGNILQAIALASVEAAYKVEAAAIIAFVMTGTMVRLLASFKPHVPIIAIVNNEYFARQMSGYRGVYPIVYTDTNDDYTPENDWAKFIQLRVEYGILHGKILGFVRSGDPIVCVHGASAVESLTDLMRIIYVSDIVKPIAY